MARTTFPLSVMAGRAARLVGMLRSGASTMNIEAALRDYGEDAPSVDSAALPALQAVADELYEVFAASSVDECAAVLNRILARWCGPPRLTTHEGTTAWHMHLDRDDDGPWDEWLASSAAYALATLLAQNSRLPGGICHDPNCDRPYLDAGAGAPQLYCSPRCASRARVSAYRRRNAESTSDPARTTTSTGSADARPPRRRSRPRPGHS